MRRAPTSAASTPLTVCSLAGGSNASRSSWYASTAPAIAAAFDAVCLRSPSCAARGPSMPRLVKLLRALRSGHGPIAAWQLAFVMDTAGLDPLAYRELDAAARAWLEQRDAVPLQRLVREATSNEEAAPADPRVESNGLFVAASCVDNPQAYDMRLPPNLRQSQWRAALAEKVADDPNVYAPFTIGEFLQIPLDYAYVPLCQNWAALPGRHFAGESSTANATMPDVPALVLTGDLDTITTTAEGDRAASSFRRALRVIVHNTGHVTAIDDPWNCASAMVRTFLQGATPNVSCARRIPPARLVDSFARSRFDVAPATLASGSASLQARRDARNALDAAADVLARARTFGSSAGSGLRGGTFSVRTGSNGLRILLHRVRWTIDLPVDGTIALDAPSNRAKADLRVGGYALRATWNALTGLQATMLLAGPGTARLIAPVL